MKDPRFLREYAELLLSAGEPKFVETHNYPVLLGVGMVGELADSKDGRRRTHDVVGSEEYVPVTSLLDRIWPLVPCDRPISERYITLGYDSECDVLIPEYTLSSNHCAFSRKEPIKVADLGSLNGTFLDDKRLPERKPVKIEDGSVLTLGRLKLKFHTAAGFVDALYAFLGE